jgi:hypothetical protein
MRGRSSIAVVAVGVVVWRSWLGIAAAAAVVVAVA